MRKVRLVLIAFLVVAGFTQEIVWVKILPPPDGWMDVAVDSRNNVIVSVNPWIVKFSPEGESLWARRVLHPYGNITQWVATDPEDNIITGKTTSESSLAVVKFTSNGDSLWCWDTVFPSPFWGMDDIATNHNGYVQVTGGYNVLQYGWITIQLTPDGHTHWVRTFSSNWGPDGAKGVCTDHLNNVIIGGSRGIYPRPRQWFPQLIKYSKNGETLAEVIYDPYPFPANLDGLGVATDRDGNMYLCGGGQIYDTILRPGYRWFGAFLFKYDPEGDPLWQWFSDTSEGWYRFTSCATDTLGNIYAAGSKAWDNRMSIILRRFKPSGELVWTFYYPLGEDLSPQLAIIAIDQEGNIIAVAPGKIGSLPVGYVLKIADVPGIAEGKEGCERSNLLLPTIINSAEVKRLTFPPDVRVEVYDTNGRLAQKLGEDRVFPLSAGVYFLRLESEGYPLTRKVVVTKTNN